MERFDFGEFDRVLDHQLAEEEVVLEGLRQFVKDFELTTEQAEQLEFEGLGHGTTTES